MVIDVENNLFGSHDVRDTPSADISLQTITVDLDLDGNSIINVAAPTDDDDAATKEYVDDSISGLTKYYSIPGIAFKNDNVTSTAVVLFVNGNLDTDAAGKNALAPVILPHGATVTGAMAWGDSTGNDWYLKRKGLGVNTAGTTMATDEIDNVNGTSRQTTISYATIDNSLYSYYFEIALANSNDWIYGASITYTTP